ncbi:alpha/beta-Hydrolases superfamily protein [Zea mays]|nr:alpha/beta-Hydrolases superfamily protein [Zea mays]
MLSFDRPGYAESDPHPARTEESIALDIAELADNLQLGRKFYLAGFSMGGEIMWSCLKYIPHRLSGVAILGPVGNYWWPGLPSNVSRDAWYQQLPRDQWAVWVAHHLPWLTYWWNTQKLFPASSVIAYNPALLSQEDEMLMAKFGYRAYMPQIRQQGEHECLHRDMMVGFGKWSWSPLQLENPFADADADDGQGAGKVHLWHGAEDLIVPVSLSRYISQKLPWVVYHELPKSGHLFPIAEGMADIIVKSLLLGDDHLSSSASQPPHSP